MFRCFDVSMFRCFDVSMFRCFDVSMFRCFDVKKTRLKPCVCKANEKQYRYNIPNAMRPQIKPQFIKHPAKWSAQKLQVALNLVLPRICELCKQYSDTDTHLCSFCRESLSPNSCPCLVCAEPIDSQSPLGCYRCLGMSLAFDHCRAPWLYNNEMRYLIRRWKFEGATHLTNTLCELFLSEIGQPSEVDVLVPTPLHWRRQLSRGFNQSKLLATALGQRLNLPVLKGFKRRYYSTPQHRTRRRADRQLN